MRKSKAFLVFTMLNLIIMVILYIHSLLAISEHDRIRKDIGNIVKILGLTDMVLATDARYTRHPTQADLFSAFQDYPGSTEHFPTGSIIPPPDFSSMGTTIR